MICGRVKKSQAHPLSSIEHSTAEEASEVIWKPLRIEVIVSVSQDYFPVI